MKSLFEKNMMYEADTGEFRSLFDDIVQNEGEYFEIPKEKIVDYFEYFNLDVLDVNVESERELDFQENDPDTLYVKFENMEYDGIENAEMMRNLEEDLEASENVDTVILDTNSGTVKLKFTSPVEIS